MLYSDHFITVSRALPLFTMAQDTMAHTVAQEAQSPVLFCFFDYKSLLSYPCPHLTISHKTTAFTEFFLNGTSSSDNFS